MESLPIWRDREVTQEADMEGPLKLGKENNKDNVAFQQTGREFEDQENVMETSHINMEESQVRAVVSVINEQTTFVKKPKNLTGLITYN